ncbi:hypothetical protein GM3708_109 [Geminocystis sp. NIES-3708]|uniref:hypothetical protein n=1 Tax=Geminocystis sp. NIES-3708 TaxID=1615909 RepID=UPI0005FC83E5|nr:hypothetical protein [Geminocystis sp. NIES-3708]BAQ59704.1 hypothetical protein GM3708_109 [Geminocystis sp. NIES-3708]
MHINQAIKQNLLKEISNQKEKIVIPDIVPQDQELINAYQVSRILDKYLLDYFKNYNKPLISIEIEKKIDKILVKFKQEVLKTLSKEKDRFRKEIQENKTTFKNIFEFAGCENLYLSNLYTRFISENMGHKLEDIAEIANNVFLPDKELDIKIKGIDLIIFHEEKIKYTQLKTKKDTLTGSQSSRSINELKIHPFSIFAAALDMGNSWTISKTSCEKYNIETLAGESFWSLLNLDYNLIVNKLAKTIKEIDKKLY